MNRQEIPALPPVGNDWATNRNVVVVTGADARYFRFASDAVASLLALEIPDISIAFMDLGLDPAQQTWLRSHNVLVKTPRTLLDLPPGAGSVSNMGYLARPFLRENFPGFAIYVWIDADVWLQDASGLGALVAGAEKNGAAVVRQNERAYRFWPWQVGWIHKHYVTGYGLFQGLSLAWRPMVNNGVFAMRADAPHWERWRHRYQSALSRTGRPAPHDQFGLNAAIYLDRLDASFLPATANWICDLAAPMWDDRAQRFCVPYAPFRPISILHLAGPAKSATFDIRTTSGTVLQRRLNYKDALGTASGP